MPDTIRIKRRQSGAAGPPAALANAELAYNEINDVLYYGKGDDGAGQSTSRVAIGGPGSFQPLDADLTAIAALTGTNVIYYRSAANTWAAVTIGTGLTFSSGTLSATGGGTGNVSNVGTPTNGQLARWTDATHIQGVDASALGFQPLDPDLTSLAAASLVDRIYYRSAADTWTAVVTGGNLTFAGGVLNAVVGEAGTSGIPYVRQSGGWADASLIFATLASPVFTGDPRAPTPATSDNDTSVATTAFVKAQGYEIAANKGVANGYASLDGSAKVPAAQLPSYVDDVVEYANLAAFPATGVAGVIYVALDTGKIYRWSGSAYVEISPSPGSTDAVPEGSVNLYYTEARVSANTTVTSKAPLASPVFTGDPQAPTPATADNDTSVATTAYVKANLASYQPLDADLSALAALAGTNVIYYRSGADTWAAVTIGTGLSFSAGTLSATGGGGGIPEPASDGFYGRNMASGVGSWVAAVKKAGDTMTGALSVGATAGAELATMSSAAGQARLLAGGTNTDVGWFCTTKGTGGSWYFYTNSFANVQVQIVHQTATGILVLAGGDGSVVSNLYKNDGTYVKTVTPPAASNDATIATTAFVKTAMAGQLVEIQRTVISSAVATVSFTTGINATYDEFEIHYFGVQTSGASTPTLVVSSDGGSSWYTTANQQFGGRIMYSISTNSAESGATGATGMQITGTHSGAAGVVLDGKVTFARPWDSTNLKYFRFESTGHHATLGHYEHVGFGTPSNTAVVNAIRFGNSGGVNFTAGTFVLYGRKK